MEDDNVIHLVEDEADGVQFLEKLVIEYGDRLGTILLIASLRGENSSVIRSNCTCGRDLAYLNTLLHASVNRHILE